MNPGTYKVVIKNNTETWYDANGKEIYYKNSNGYEEWSEYDAKGNLIHSKNSNGDEYWYDTNGKKIHYKNSNGYESWWEYDSNGNIIHYNNSNGLEVWYDSKGKNITKEEFDAIHSSCHGKVIDIDGKKYQLCAILSSNNKGTYHESRYP